MSDTETAEWLLTCPDPRHTRAVADQAFRLYGGPIMHTSIEKTLAVLIGAGALDEEALERMTTKPTPTPSER